jgi:hypothetical protein
VVKVAEIGSVEGGARKDSRRKRREGLRRILESGRCRLIMAADEVGTVTSVGDDCIRTALTVREFGDGAGGGIAVDLDACHH